MDPYKQRALDHEFMRIALALGRQGRGLTAPNPSVGAVLVKENKIIGRGVTGVGGRPHAEMVALAEAGTRAAGSCLYVTLEPCSHYGQTFPCAEAICAAEVKRVVYPFQDPDPRVCGAGVARLRLEKKIEILEGIGEQEALYDHWGHILRMKEHRPLVTLKIAETSDNYMGHRGERVKITEPSVDLQIHLLRSQYEAILVGVGTVRTDNPQLTVRLPGAVHAPVSIVLDTHFSLAHLPPAIHLLAQASKRPVLVLGGEEAPEESEKLLQAYKIHTCRLPYDSSGKIALRNALAYIAELGIARLLVEGGPGIASNFIQEHWADDIRVYRGNIDLPSSVPEADRCGLSCEARRTLYSSQHYLLSQKGGGGQESEIWHKAGAPFLRSQGA